MENALDNNLFIKESTLRLAKLLATSGRYDESIKLLEGISSSSLSKELIKEYYVIYKRCYAELRIISRIKSISAKYDKLYSAYKDSFNIHISNLDENSKFYLEVKEQSFRDVRDTKMALEINAKRLELAKFGTREYAMAAFQ